MREVATENGSDQPSRQYKPDAVFRAIEPFASRLFLWVKHVVPCVSHAHKLAAGRRVIHGVRVNLAPIHVVDFAT